MCHLANRIHYFIRLGKMNQYNSLIKSRSIEHFWIWLFISILSFSSATGQDAINFGTLIDEMTSLDRLTYLPEQSYQTIQYSSYDRRSQIPGMIGWFYNSDGFGGEPIPGFEKVIIPPDTSGIGT